MNTPRGKAGRKIAGLRIAFFFDGPQVVVCTNAFYKAVPTPQDARDLAMRERGRYFQAKERRELGFRIEEED